MLSDDALPSPPPYDPRTFSDEQGSACPHSIRPPMAAPPSLFFGDEFESLCGASHCWTAGPFLELPLVVNVPT